MAKRGLLALLLMAALVSCGSKAPSVGDGGGSGEQGVRGQVFLGPMCPVEQAGSPCPDQPVPGTVVVLKKIGEAVAQVRTDPSGRFFLSLAPGSYLIYANELSDNPRQSKFQPITLRAGETLRLDLVIDSGIR